MKGLILAGGQGSRLRPYTEDRPKALVEVGGRSLLDRQVAALRLAGTEDLCVIAGWMAERFDELVIDTIVDADAASTMVDALRGAHHWFERAPCVVAYGDIVFDPEDARRLVASEADVAIAYDPDWLALWTERFGDPLLDAEVFKHADGLLLEAGGRASTLDEVEGQYIGLLRTTPPGWSALVEVADRASSQGNPVIDVTDLLTRAVRAGQPVGVVPVQGVWWEVDHPTDLELGRSRFDHLDHLLFG